MPDGVRIFGAVIVHIPLDGQGMVGSEIQGGQICSTPA